jgi:glycosyltransferase 2 family protein
LLYLAFRGVDWREIVRTVQGARVEYLALALCRITVASFIRSLRWRVLLSAEKSLPSGTVFWATMAGYLGNNFLPARAGEVIRTVLIGQAADLSKSFVLATALTERMMDVVALVLISLAALSALQGLPAELLKAVQVMSLYRWWGWRACVCCRAWKG